LVPDPPLVSVPDPPLVSVSDPPLVSVPDLASSREEEASHNWTLPPLAIDKRSTCSRKEGIQKCYTLYHQLLCTHSQTTINLRVPPTCQYYCVTDAQLMVLQVVPFVDCCVSLLERPDILPGPLAQSRIVSVLLAFVNSDRKGRHSQ